MTRFTTGVAFAILLVSCGVPNDDRRSSGAPENLNLAENPTVSNAPVPAVQASPYYLEATQCTALVNIVSILVSSDVIDDPNIVNFAGRASGTWLDRATVEGRKFGKTASEVQLDIDRKQYELLLPLKTLPENRAAARIQALVRRAGDCKV